MQKLTNQDLEQVNGGGYYWQQCDIKIESAVFGWQIDCGQIYGMTYNSWNPFDYLYAKGIVDAQMADHKSNAH